MLKPHHVALAELSQGESVRHHYQALLLLESAGEPVKAAADFLAELAVVLWEGACSGVVLVLTLQVFRPGGFGDYEFVHRPFFKPLRSEILAQSLLNRESDLLKGLLDVVGEELSSHYAPKERGGLYPDCLHVVQQ